MTPVPGRGLATFAGQAAVLTGRNLRLSLTPASVAFAVVTPLIFFVGFLVVFRKLFLVQGIHFEQYLPPAIVVMWVSFTGMSAALFFARDRRSGMLARLRSMPLRHGSIITARIAADVVRALISIAIVLVAAYLAGFRFRTGVPGGVGFVLVALAFLVTTTAGTSAAGLASRDPEGTASLLQLPNMPLLMLSTAFAPVVAFPGWLQPFVRYSPFTAVIESLRALADGTALTGPLLRAAAWLIGVGLVFSWLAVRAFRRAT